MADRYTPITDISDSTNLSATSPITLTDDDIGLDATALGTAFVPYTGATANVDLGAYSLTATTITDGTASLSGGNLTSMGNISGSDIDITTGTGQYSGKDITLTSGTEQIILINTDFAPVSASIFLDGVGNLVLTPQVGEGLIVDSDIAIQGNVDIAGTLTLPNLGTISSLHLFGSSATEVNVAQYYTAISQQAGANKFTLKLSGAFTGGTDTDYEIEIDGQTVGSETFKWRKDTGGGFGGWTSGVSVQAGFNVLDEAVKIAWNDSGGDIFIIGDAYSFTAEAAPETVLNVDTINGEVTNREIRIANPTVTVGELATLNFNFNDGSNKAGGRIESRVTFSYLGGLLGDSAMDFYTAKDEVDVLALTIDEDQNFDFQSGNATFDTTTLFVDATNHRVGVGTITPDVDFHSYGSNSIRAVFERSGSANIVTKYKGTSGEMWCGVTNNDFFISSANVLTEGNFTVFTQEGLVGIGVTDPDTTLEIFDTTTQLKLSYDATNYTTFATGSDGDLTITTVDSDGAAGDIALMPDGNVGVKQATPLNPLHVLGTVRQEGVSYNMQISEGSNILGSNHLYIKASGSFLSFESAAGQDTYFSAGGSFVFRDIDSANATRVSIDSATGETNIFGNLLVGTTDLVVDTTAHTVSVGSADGSNKLLFKHDNSNAWIKWDDGELIAETNEGTNTESVLDIRGKGTGAARLKLKTNTFARYQDSATAFEISPFAALDVTFSSSATDAETPEVQVHGFPTGLSKKYGSFQVVNIGGAPYFQMATDGTGLSLDALTLISGNLLVNTTDLVVDTTAHTVSVGSADGSNYLEFSHSNANPSIKWDDGDLLFTSVEAANSNTILKVRGNGTGTGTIKLEDEDNAEALVLNCISGLGVIRTEGAAAGNISMQNTAHADIIMFLSAADAETPLLKIHGFPTGLSNKYGSFQVVDIGGAPYFQMATDGTGISLEGITRIGDGATNTNYTAFSATGDQTFAGSAGFYPRFLTQAAEPAAGTGATQLDTSEFCVWKDSDDNTVRLCFNDGGTVKTVALA